MNSRSRKKDRDKKRKNQLETIIFQIMEKSMKAALKVAIDDVLKSVS